MSNRKIDLSISLTEQQSTDLQRFSETSADGQRYDVPADRMKDLESAGFVRSTNTSSYEFTDIGKQLVDRLAGRGDDQTLDVRLKSAGMFSVAELLNGSPIDQFVRHAGVHDIATFVQWVEMKRAEYLKLQARYDLGDKPKDDLYEWVTSHSAVFAEVHVNLKAASAAVAFTHSSTRSIN